ncbi:MAG: site-specific DNA-methyltransferase [Pirellulales bacterium]
MVEVTHTDEARGNELIATKGIEPIETPRMGQIEADPDPANGQVPDLIPTSCKNPVVIQGDAGRLPLPDQSVDLVFASPPYMDARTYGTDDIARDCSQWVEWMLAVTHEALRVSRGVVMWVVAGVQRKGLYQPAPEGLAWEAHRAGIRLLWPNYWQKNSLPRGKAWFRPETEYVLAFCRQNVKPYFDHSEIGLPPKYGRGGRFRNRRKDGSRDDGVYPTVKLAVPGNVCYVTVGGGGHMGSVLAHENEAPFPERLADRFVRACCPPGGIVLDPFCGSGTTLAAAMKAGRRSIGVDIRAAQCELTKRRLREASC